MEEGKNVRWEGRMRKDEIAERSRDRQERGMREQ